MFRTRDGRQDWQTLPGHAWQVHPLRGHVGVGFQYSRDGRAGWRIPQPGRQATAGAHLASGITPTSRTIESIAHRPKDPTWSMRGTWHLAWKTADGGSNWQHINPRDDRRSDVFSIIVTTATCDSSSPDALLRYLQSLTAGDHSKRSRAFLLSAAYARCCDQDRPIPNIGLCRTTEGLWKTRTWQDWKRVRS